MKKRAKKYLTRTLAIILILTLLQSSVFAEPPENPRLAYTQEDMDKTHNKATRYYYNFGLEKRDNTVHDFHILRLNWRNAPFVEVDIDKNFDIHTSAPHQIVTTVEVEGTGKLFQLITTADRNLFTMSGMSMHYRDYDSLPDDIISDFNIKPTDYKDMLQHSISYWYYYTHSNGDKTEALCFDVLASDFGTGVYSVGNYAGAAYKNFIINAVDVYHIEILKARTPSDLFYQVEDPDLTQLLLKYPWQNFYMPIFERYLTQHSADEKIYFPDIAEIYETDDASDIFGIHFSRFYWSSADKYVEYEDVKDIHVTDGVALYCVYDYVIDKHYVEGTNDISYHKSQSGEKVEQVQTGENTRLTAEQLAPPPERDGYMFDGWYLFNNPTKDQEGLSSTSPDLSQAQRVDENTLFFTTDGRNAINLYAAYVKSPTVPIEWDHKNTNPSKTAVAAMYGVLESSLKDELMLYELDSSYNNYSNTSLKTFNYKYEDLPQNFTNEPRAYDDKIYTFNGWEVKGNLGTTSLAFLPKILHPYVLDKYTVIYPLWTVVDRASGSEMTVTLNANGGSFADGSATDTITTNKDVAFLDLENPTKDRHTFLGWEDDDGNFYDVNDVTASSIRFYEDIELTAVWKPFMTFEVLPFPGMPLTIKLAEVTDSNIPTAIKDEINNHDEVSTQNFLPMTTAITVNVSDGSGGKVETDVPIYDYFLSAIPNNPAGESYLFIGNDGKRYSFSHFTFDHSDPSETDGIFKKDTEFRFSGTVTLTPVFKEIETPLTVTYTLDGVPIASIEPQTYAKGEDILLPTPPAHSDPDNYGFVSWELDGVSADSLGATTEAEKTDSIIPYSAVESNAKYPNITIEADFVELIEISFDMSNASDYPDYAGLQSVKLMPDSSYQLPRMPDKTTENSIIEHHGWQYKETGSSDDWDTIMTQDFKFTEDTTVQPIILASSFATAGSGAVITFDLNNEAANKLYPDGFESQTVYGTPLISVPYIAAFEELNTTYTFVGWFDESGNQINEKTIFSENTTLKARWTETDNGTDLVRVTFDLSNANAGATLAPIAAAEFERGGKLSYIPEIPTTLNVGIFQGFYLEKDTPTTPVTTDMTFDTSTVVYGHWDGILSLDEGDTGTGTGTGTETTPNEEEEETPTTNPPTTSTPDGGEDDDDTDTGDNEDGSPTTNPTNPDDDNEDIATTPPGTPEITPEGEVVIKPTDEIPSITPEDVFIDEKPIDSLHITTTEQGEITIAPDAFEGLADGEHKLTIRQGDKSYDSVFIMENNVPTSFGEFEEIETESSNGWLIWAGLFLILIALLLIFLIYKKRRKQEDEQ